MPFIADIESPSSAFMDPPEVVVSCSWAMPATSAGTLAPVRTSPSLLAIVM